jgi:hypothetical protein
MKLATLALALVAGLAHADGAVLMTPRPADEAEVALLTKELSLSVPPPPFLWSTDTRTLS